MSYPGPSLVLLAIHVEGLVKIAREADSLIEVVPQVGDFVVHGDPLARVYGHPVVRQKVLNCFAMGNERTVDQDPTFAIRIIVDVACRALSPAINDPTTGVLALDQLHLLLRLAGLRRLRTGTVRDQQGEVRVIFRTPNWEDFVWLALTEIRHYGAANLQIARRMRALILHLLEVLPEKRHACLRRQLALLDDTVASSFPREDDRQHASVGDLQGLGGSTALVEEGT